MRRALAIALLCAAAVLVTLAPGTASAATGITKFTLDQTSSQAGGHPDVTIYAEFLNHESAPRDPCLCDDVRTIRIDFPAGFIGNPHAVPKCKMVEFATSNCPPEAQVGVIGQFAYTPVFNMETNPDQAGLLAMNLDLGIGIVTVFVELSGRTESDYGLTGESPPVFHIIPIPFLPPMHLWGVPADPVHDDARFLPFSQSGQTYCILEYPNPCPDVTGATSDVPPAPYLQNPTACGVAQSATLQVGYYNGAAHSAEAPWPATTGCDLLSFDPSLVAKPTTTRTDTASGLDVDLRVPQNLSPTTPTPSQIRRVTTTLPEGFTINPNAADGKLACPDANTGIGTRGPATCPEFSKVGTTMVDVSALPGPIFGGLYLAEPRPGEPYRLVLTADGFATHVKLIGNVMPDPRTGRLTTVFEQPQAPLQRVLLHFFGSERGLLATPPKCGAYSVQSEFVPWNSVLPNQTSTSFITIDSGPGGAPCPGASRPFVPRLQAGSENSTAGMHAPFRLKLDRDDGDQNLTGLRVTTPPGFAATLAGVPYCPEAAVAALSDPLRTGLSELASSACPAASRIGSAVAGAGAGSSPLHVAGKVYLAGPYKGAPLSLVVVIPAVSGPYDLGNVAVRAAIQVDPVSARVTTLSDPLPQILEGIPLRTRSILVDLDRPGFTLNPTNCSPFSVETLVSGDEGAAAALSAHFQVANCADLDFAPKLDLRLRGSTKRRGNPALRAVLRRSPGEASLRRVATTMPSTLLLDNSHIGNICTRVQFAAERCPANSAIGSMTVHTPILDAPLRGPVYLRSSSNLLPDLVADLEGQFEVELAARIDTPKGRGLRATFAATPDVPFSRAVLDLEGGSKGLLISSVDLCKTRPKADVRLVGQNGARVKRATRLRTRCGKRRRGHRR